MNAIERGNNYAINVNGNNNKNYDKKKKKLFNDSFLWKCHFIWLFKKKYEQFLQTSFNKRFVALYDIGLIVMD